MVGNILKLEEKQYENMRISQLIWPRPVVIVTTISKDGRPNGMTASFVSPISFHPMYIGFAISPRRYTFQLLKENPEFGVCVLEERQKDIAVIFGTRSGRDVDKFKLSGVRTFRGKRIRPPLIECPVAFECELVDMREYGDHYWVVGKVLEVHLRKKDFKPLLHYSEDVFPRVSLSKV